MRWAPRTSKYILLVRVALFTSGDGFFLTPQRHATPVFSEVTHAQMVSSPTSNLQLLQVQVDYSLFVHYFEWQTDNLCTTLFLSLSVYLHLPFITVRVCFHVKKCAMLRSTLKISCIINDWWWNHYLSRTKPATMCSCKRTLNKTPGWWVPKNKWNARSLEGKISGTKVAPNRYKRKEGMLHSKAAKLSSLGIRR
jgi:hypothetical protein